MTITLHNSAGGGISCTDVINAAGLCDAAIRNTAATGVVRHAAAVLF